MTMCIKDQRVMQLLVVKLQVLYQICSTSIYFDLPTQEGICYIMLARSIVAKYYLSSRAKVVLAMYNCMYTCILYVCKLIYVDSYTLYICTTLCPLCMYNVYSYVHRVCRLHVCYTVHCIYHMCS